MEKYDFSRIKFDYLVLQQSLFFKKYTQKMCSRQRDYIAFRQAKDAVPKQTGETHSGKRVKIIISKGVERVSDGNPGRDRVAVTAGTARWLAIRAVMTNCLSISTCHTKISRVSRVFSSNFLPAFSALSLGRALYSRL